MSDKTNQELYDKMIEGFNNVLEETSDLKRDTYAINDKVKPIHQNVRDIYSFNQTLLTKVDKLESRIKDLENEIARLKH